jgi:FtsP/CotA-like multicopper oxidase with cupredoxin domain
LLNASNSRIYKLAWKDGQPLTVIGTDGGLLERPVNKRYVLLSPGERLEIWADFSDYPVGYETSMISLPFDAEGGARGRMGRGMPMGPGMGRDPRLPNGAEFSILNIHVTRSAKNHLTLKDKLSDIEPFQQDNAVNFSRPRQFFLTMRHMQWTINGRVFEMEGVASDEIVRLGTTEIWEFHNTGGGMMRMMNLPHPMHLHGRQFRIIGRSGVRHEGYVDDGWKDTVLLMPGESARIGVAFDVYPGMFLYHCHNLEHEDMGMMRNYFIRSS